MAFINSNLCFKQSLMVENSEVGLSSKLNLEKLAITLTNLTDDSNFKSETNLYYHLTIHIGEESTYTHKSTLIDNLKNIERYLYDHSFSSDKKKLIADKILEGIRQCTPGFHNRLEMIQLSLKRPANIDDFLFLLRMSIVETAALQHTSGTHMHNAFFKKAEQLDCGVRPLNKNDAYSEKMEIGAAGQKTIDKEFAERYTPMAIVAHLFSSLNDELINYYDYRGYSEQGYDFVVYGKAKELVEKILGSPVDFRDFLIAEYDEFEIPTIVHDINWQTIHLLLLQKLHNEEYILFSIEEFNFLQQLFSNNINEEILNNNKEIIDDLNLIQHPELLIKLSREDRKLIKKFVFSNLDAPTFENCSAQLMLYDLWASIDSDDENSTISGFWQKFFANKENKKNFIDNITKIPKKVKSSGLAHLDFSSLTLCPQNLYFEAAEHQPQAILHLLDNARDIKKFLSQRDSYKNSLFMLAAQYQPEAMRHLLDHTQGLDEKEIMTLLSATNHNGETALMVAAKFQPLALKQILERIKGFSPANKLKLLSPCFGAKELFYLAARYQPEGLKLLLTSIEAFDETTKMKLLSNKDLFAVAACHQPQALNDLLEFVKKFSKKNKTKLFFKRDGFGYNLLMQAASNKESTASIFATLNKSNLVDLLYQQEYMGKTALICAALSSSGALETILTEIKKFNINNQKNILLHQDVYNNNALIYAAGLDEESNINCLLNSIETYDVNFQIELFSQKFSTENVALECIRKNLHRPEILKRFFKIIDSFPSDVQHKLLIESKCQYTFYDPFKISGIESFLKDIKNGSVYFSLTIQYCISKHFYSQINFSLNLSERIQALDDNNPIEKALKKCLSNMSYKSEAKKCAIFDAYYYLRNKYSEPEEFQTQFRIAIDDKHNPLYKALNLKRYLSLNPSTFFRGTKSLIDMKKAVNQSTSIKK